MISFPAVDAPTVTVAMAVYGRWDWVERAITALCERTPAPYEVVVVDNDSPDDAGDRLATEVEGIALIRNPTNEGFGRAINRVAERARAPFLCILNSDALVQEGWLPPLLAAMDDPGVGVALPRYLAIDGSVLEAGSTVGADGVTVPIGRGLAADAPEVRFPRVVDFGSAACMVVRTEAFRSVGGFADAYGLGYYEDVELCLELRARALRTVYVPASDVQHGLGASLSKEEARARSEANRPIFVGRRAADLVGRPDLEPWEEHPHRLVHARDWPARFRVLVLAERLPLDGPGTAALVAALAERPDARVTVAVGPGAEAADVDALLRAGVEVAPEADTAWFAERAGHATAVLFGGPSAAARFRETVAQTQPQATVLVDLAGPSAGRGPDVRRVEADAIRSARVVLAPSEAHAAFVREIAPAAAVVVSGPDGAAGRTLVETLGMPPAGP